MIRTLRRKFVRTAMGALTLILLLLIGTLNLANYIRVQRNADDLLEILAENGGSFPGGGAFDGRAGGSMQPGATAEQSERPSEKPPEKPSGSVPEKPAQAPGEDFLPGERRGASERRGRLFRDNGLFGFSRTAETPFETRWFWVRLNAEGARTRSDITHIASIDEETALAMAQTVFQSGEKRGTSGDYRYLMRAASGLHAESTQADRSGETIVVFLDWRSDLHSARLLLAVSVLTAAAMLLLMLLLATLFSSRAIAPTLEAFEKQKRFVSDASHELKTPLSVISADVDVLEMTGEKSEWTASIRDQIARMNQLIRDMLTLSRMEEDQRRAVFVDVDLSAVVTKAAAPFFVVAKAAGKRFATDIAPGVHLSGDADALAQLVSILADNAMKYSSEESEIQLKLARGARGEIRLETANVCGELPEGNLDRLFDRFYRADASRSKKTGGFGIGLSVARAITESHGGRIRAERDGDHIIRFIALFSARAK